MLQFEGGAQALTAAAQWQAAEGPIAAEPFMRGEAVFMWPLATPLLKRVTPAAAQFIAAVSMPGGAEFMPAAGERLPADGATRRAGAA
jgi:hypothetical protein